MSGYLAVWDLWRKIALVVALAQPCKAELCPGAIWRRWYYQARESMCACAHLSPTGCEARHTRTRMRDLEPPCDCRQVEPVLMSGWRNERCSSVFSIMSTALWPSLVKMNPHVDQFLHSILGLQTSGAAHKSCQQRRQSMIKGWWGGAHK